MDFFEQMGHDGKGIMLTLTDILGHNSCQQKLIQQRDIQSCWTAVCMSQLVNICQIVTEQKQPKYNTVQAKHFPLQAVQT